MLSWLVVSYACIFEKLSSSFYMLYFKAYINLFVYIICSYANLIKTCVIYVQFLSYTWSSCDTCFISFVYSFYIWLYIVCPYFWWFLHDYIIYHVFWEKEFHASFDFWALFFYLYECVIHMIIVHSLFYLLMNLLSWAYACAL